MLLPLLLLLLMPQLQHLLTIQLLLIPLPLSLHPLLCLPPLLSLLLPLQPVPAPHTAASEGPS